MATNGDIGFDTKSRSSSRSFVELRDGRTQTDSYYPFTGLAHVNTNIDIDSFASDRGTNEFSSEGRSSSNSFVEVTTDHDKDLCSELVSVNRKLEAAEYVKSKLKETVANKDKELTGLRNNLADKGRELEEYEIENAMLKDKLNALTEDYGFLKKKFEKLMSDRNQECSDCKIHEERNSELTNEVKALKENVSTTENAISIKESIISAHEATKKELKQHYDKRTQMLENRIHELTKTLHSLLKELRNGIKHTSAAMCHTTDKMCKAANSSTVKNEGKARAYVALSNQQFAVEGREYASTQDQWKRDVRTKGSQRDSNKRGYNKR